MGLPYCAEIWLPGYVKDRVRRLGERAAGGESVGRVWVTLADHYEPLWRERDEGIGRERVQRWRRQWPGLAERHRDGRGRPAQYTFFYPAEEYRPELVEGLAELARKGLGDVEVHLHHDGEGEQAFIERMEGFKEALHGRHGLLRKVGGRIAFGFIHGNWALDNSRPDGRWCGLNNEIRLLRELGCYADFTMPCGPRPMQARMINAIYWATDDPRRPKSYDRGVRVEQGREGDLLMISGPFGLRWRERRFEIGELASYDPPTAYRVRRWLELAPRVGREVFLKLFTHGAQERNAACLLGGGLELMLGRLRAECEERGWELRYATAWEMAEAVRAAAGSGKAGEAAR
jgi:hypothetical protein